jgi:hypothetical protein
MKRHWITVTLNSEAEVLDKMLELRGKQWLSRGQSKPYGALVPSIDRGELANLSRQDKLARERASIDLFRATSRFFAGGEQGALQDDFVALFVLRHYAVPTRLLDWSISPYVAAYFAVHEHDSEDAEFWSFDRVHYEEIGKEQWKRWPETTTDGRGDDASKFSAGLTAFMVDEPPDWFVAAFYPSGFPRQDAQSGAYTMTARFGRDHAEVLKNLLKDDSKHRRYLIPANLKPALRQILRQAHGIWRGTLFPDSAGAAETAKSAFSTSV